MFLRTLKEVIVSPCLYIMIILFACCGFFTGFASEVQTPNGYGYSLLEGLISIPKQEWKNYFDASDIWLVYSYTKAGSFYLLFLAPVLSGLQSVSRFYDEFQSGYARSAMIRSGFQKYIKEKILYLILTSCCVVIGGIILFSLLMYMILPHIYMMSADCIDTYRLVFNINDNDIVNSVYFLPGIILNCTRLILYMCQSSFISIVCAAYGHDKYNCVCFSCFLYYLMLCLDQKLPSFSIAFILLSPLTPIKNDNILLMGTYFLFWFIVMYSLYKFRMNKLSDKGEIDYA